VNSYVSCRRRLLTSAAAAAAVDAAEVAHSAAATVARVIVYVRSKTTRYRLHESTIKTHIRHYQRPVSMCWLTAILIVNALMCAAEAIEQKPAFASGVSVSDAGRSHGGKRRLRDLVLAGVNANPLSSYDADNNRRSVAESLERLLHLGYRYFELDVQEHNRVLHWSAGSCNVVAETLRVHEEISPALVALASFSQQFPSDVFLLRFALTSEPELRASSGCRLLASISAHLASRSVPATRVFESTVNEMLSTERNVVILVRNLSSMLPSSVTDVRSLHLPNIFVDDINTVRNKTDVTAWNVVDRGGSVLDQHRSVDTLSVLILNWDEPDASTPSSILCRLLQISLLPLVVVSIVVCLLVSRLSAGRWSVYSLFGGVVAASTVMTFLLSLRVILSSTSPPSVSNIAVVNKSCTAVVDAARYWLARPTRYRLNVFVVDHRKYCCGSACSTTPTSGVVGLAAIANAGRIRLQVALTHAGSPLSEAVGLRAIFSCPPVLFAYVVTSRDEGHVVAWNHLSDGDVVVFEEGEFPMDATVAVYVATVWNRWMRVS